MKAPRKSTRRPRPVKPVRPDNESSCAIGELAKLLAVSQRTIRFYESKGLIAPGRKGTQRVYTVADQTRLRLILRTKNLGFSLQDIARHLALYGDEPKAPAAIRLRLTSVEEVIELLDAKLEDLRVTMDELQEIRARYVAGLRRSR